MLGGYDYEVYEIPLENPQKLKSRKTDFPETGFPGNRVSRKPENTEVVSNDFKVNNDITTIVINEQSNKDKTTYIKKYFEKYIGVITPNNFIELMSYLDDGMEADVIIRAVDEAVGSGVKNYKYVKTILNNWIEAGVKTVLELTEYQNEFERKKKSKQEKKQSNSKTVNTHNVNKNKFANFNQTFTQYEEKELDEIIKKSQKEKFK
ncbi:DnaD domain-containing protein [Clostridioides difficile]